MKGICLILDRLNWRETYPNLRKPVRKLSVTVVLLVICVSWCFHIWSDMGRHLSPWSTCLLLLITGLLAVATVMVLQCIVMCLYEIHTAILDSIVIEEPVETYHGRNLPEVMHNIRKMPVEFFAAFDKYGNRCMECTTFDHGHVCIDDVRSEIIMTSSTIHLHNHPCSTLAFSPNDIRTAVSLHCKKSIVTASSMVYTLEIPDGIELDSEEVKEYTEQQYRRAVSLLNMAGYDVAMTEAGELTIGHVFSSRRIQKEISIIACRGVAEKFGMKFTAVPYEESEYCQTKSLFYRLKKFLSQPAFVVSVP